MINDHAWRCRIQRLRFSSLAQPHIQWDECSTITGHATLHYFRWKSVCTSSKAYMSHFKIAAPLNNTNVWVASRASKIQLAEQAIMWTEAPKRALITLVGDSWPLWWLTVEDPMLLHVINPRYERFSHSLLWISVAIWERTLSSTCVWILITLSVLSAPELV